MDCPACNDPDAYVGFTDVDCLNPDCSNFKEAYLETRLQESEHRFDHLIENLGLGDELADLLDQMWLQTKSSKDLCDTLCIPKSDSDSGDTECDS